jgi:hypothetical protein
LRSKPAQKAGSQIAAQPAAGLQPHPESFFSNREWAFAGEALAHGHLGQFLETGGDGFLHDRRGTHRRRVIHRAGSLRGRREVHADRE